MKDGNNMKRNPAPASVFTAVANALDDHRDEFNKAIATYQSNKTDRNLARIDLCKKKMLELAQWLSEEKGNHWNNKVNEWIDQSEFELEGEW